MQARRRAATSAASSRPRSSSTTARRLPGSTSASKEYPWLDIGVDDHAEPLAELRRLYEEARRKYLVFSRFLPTRGDPSGVFDREIINAEVERLAKALQS